jgi:peptidoglycan/LPS O-acetylase OafA/YrhL
MESSIIIKQDAIGSGKEENVSKPVSSTRIHSMDSLRGIASFQVLLHHVLGVTVLFYGVSPDSINPHFSFLMNLITYSPLHILWAGPEAVIFFFVMSGFVLSIPYYKGKGGSYSSFFIKRIFRIYAPYLIAILIGLALNAIYVPHARMNALSMWVNGVFTKSISFNEAIDYIFFLKGDFPRLVTSLWSLPVEIKISLVLPFILMPIKKLGINLSLILPILNIAFYHIGKRLGFQSAWNDFALFYYFSFFLFGAVLSKYQHVILPIFNKLSKRWLYTLLILCILMYTYRWNIVWLPEQLFNIFKKIPSDYIVCVAALLLIVISMTENINRVLSHSYLVELGRISFSLYLIHPIIIAVLAIHLGNIIPVYALVTLGALVSILLAFPFHYWVEWPLQKLGRTLGDKFK